MFWDLTIVLENRPGELANIGETLGKAGVNIEGISAVYTGDDEIQCHVVVADVEAARNVLRKNSFPVRRILEVLLQPVDDKPGVLGQIARQLADEGVNITIAYIATNSRLVIGADDTEALQRVWNEISIAV